MRGVTLAAARRRLDELDARRRRRARRGSPSSRALVEDTEGFEPGEEDELRAERERMRHVAELGEGAAAAAAAIEPDDGDGARALAAAAERALAPLERLAPELAGGGRRAARRSSSGSARSASDVRRFAESLDADPARVAEVEERLDRIADAKRRHRAATLDELLERRAAALRELDAVGGGRRPARPRRAAERDAARGAVRRSRHAARGRAPGGAEPFAAAVAAELADLGMGEGEFHVELREREPGPTGTDEVVVPRAAERRAAARTRRRDGIGRRAVAHRARDRRRRGRRDDRARRDRRGRRRRDRAPGGRRPAPARRAGAGLTITHLPQIASVADQHLRVEKVPGRPDAHADRRARRRRAPRRARADARRRGVRRAVTSDDGP